MQNISVQDFFKETHYNKDTKNQLWMSTIADFHDAICDCFHPFAHMLASIFPPGHQDRNLTINQILQRDYQETCHSGGAGEENSGGKITTEKQPTEREEKDGQEEEDTLDALLAAAAEEEEGKR